MKFKTFHQKAKFLDDFVDDYRKRSGASFAPMRNLQEMVLTIFPDAVMVNLGLHKLVFRLRHKRHELALKIGKRQAIELDHEAYRQLPSSLRLVYFATVFWHTKYCLLQEFGAETEVSEQQLRQLRTIAGKYGLLDITCDNIRCVNGRVKIVDASIAPRGLFGLWKAADSLKLRLPEPVRRAIRKSRLLITVK